LFAEVLDRRRLRIVKTPVGRSGALAADRRRGQRQIERARAGRGRRPKVWASAIFGTASLWAVRVPMSRT
jgi:hypothetical protein